MYMYGMRRLLGGCWEGGLGTHAAFSAAREARSASTWAKRRAFAASRPPSISARAGAGLISTPATHASP
jgi:hypothetical protein